MIGDYDGQSADYLAGGVLPKALQTVSSLLRSFSAEGKEIKVVTRLELFPRFLACVLAALALSWSLTEVASAKEAITVRSTCKEEVVKAETVATSRKLSYSVELTSTEQSDSLGTAGVWVQVTFIYKLTIMGKASPGIIKFTPFYDGNSCRVESSKSQEADEIVKDLKKQKGK